MILTTTETIPGKKITEIITIVRGNTIRARHIGADIGANIKNIFGGEIKGYTKMITEARDEAMQRMVHEAKEVKADAIVNIRFVTAEVMQGAAEVLVYGTAVKLH